ncbi:MAG: YidC/Oxa1 family membrane protein insertase [Eubacterium sp.]|nr:YidC/Oxa1 family membrane protein insertase [Eubacterium sp.]
MLLTQSTTPIIGWIATLLGYVMELIFRALSSVGIENIGLCIIFFTIFVRILLLPLMISQQKFQKLNAVMQPEISKIQKKYRGKKDQVSLQKQNEEIKAVYEKYGTNTTAGCLQLFIQLPIMFALFQVIRKIPAYIPEVKAHYTTIVNAISGMDGYVAKLNKIIEGLGTNYVRSIEASSTANYVIDQMSYFTKDAWGQLASAFPSASSVITEASGHIIDMNNFVAGIDITRTPGFHPSIYWIIPILAGLFQFLSAKTMPQPNTGDSSAGMAKSMTTMMPLMSVYFCLIMPVGLGIYWITSAVLQLIQQLALNRYFDHVDMDQLVEKNLEKAAKKKASGKKSLTERITGAIAGNKEAENEGVKITSEYSQYRTIRGNASIKTKTYANPNEGKQINYEKLGEIGKAAYSVQELDRKSNPKGGNQ